MNAAVGHSAVVLGLVGALVGMVALGLGLARGKTGWLRSGQRHPWLVVLAAVAAAGAMEHALVTWSALAKAEAEAASTPSGAPAPHGSGLPASAP